MAGKRGKTKNKKDKIPAGVLKQFNAPVRIENTEYLQELWYLQNRACNKSQGYGYLPSPEEIEELKEIIKEENRLRDLAEAQAGVHSTPPPYVPHSYRLSTTK
jgi:hypothetical protein